MKSDSKVFKSTATRLKEIQEELEQAPKWSLAQGLATSGLPLFIIGLVMTIDTIVKLFDGPTELSASLLDASLVSHMVMMTVGGWLVFQGNRSKPKKRPLS